VRPRAAEGLLVAGLLAAEGIVFSRGLDTRPNFDEAVYLASLDALRHGQALGGDVFASQPPGFYVLLRVAGFFGGDSVAGIRTVFLLVALLGCLGAYVLGRAADGPLAGFVASGLLAITPPFASEASHVSADVPAVSLAVLALGLAAVAFRKRVGLWLPIAAGAVLGVAVSIKLLALTAVVPFAALAWQGRARSGQLAAAAAGALLPWAALAVAYAGSLGALWDGAVTFHRESRSFPSPEPAGDLLRDFLDWHTPSAWLLVAGAAASLLVWRRVWPLWTWTAIAVGFLFWQKPLFEHHLVLLAAAAALPAGTALGGAARLARRPGLVLAGGAAAAALAAGLYQQGHRLDLTETREQPDLVRAARLLGRCTTPAQLVASDQPIVAFRARRSLPGQLVDTSLVRLSTPSLPPERVLEIVREQRVAAVVADRSFVRYPLLLRGFRTRFGAPLRAGGARVYLSSRRPGCR
jgi:4-amino-4-deoxy-L-arabinose transferase-like glycosyltransferase